MAAPALAASIAESAISLGVFGNSGCFFVVSPEPVIAQVIITSLFIINICSILFLKGQQVSIFLKTGRVKAEWADYNGHMNLAYYIHLFDGAWEVLLGKFNIGEDSAKIEKRTTFAVESHTTYDKELKVGDEVDLNLLFLDRDKKRLVYKLEMKHKQEKYLASTTEVCSLYVDLSQRKVIEFENEKKDLIDKYISDNKESYKPGKLYLINKLKK